MQLCFLGDAAFLLRARSPDRSACFLVAVREAVGFERCFERVRNQPEPRVEGVHLADHPFERDVREPPAFVSAADVGMSPREPHLPDAFASGPQGRDEIGAFLVDRQCLASVLDSWTEFAVAEPHQPQLLPVDEAKPVEFGYPVLPDGVPDADQADRRLVVVPPEARAALESVAFLVLKPDSLGVVGRVVVVCLGSGYQARARDEGAKRSRRPGPAREAEDPDLVAAPVDLGNQQIGVDHAVVQSNPVRASEQAVQTAAPADPLQIIAEHLVAAADEIRADRSAFLDPLLFARQQSEQPVDVGLLARVVPCAVQAHDNLSAHLFSWPPRLRLPLRCRNHSASRTQSAKHTALAPA